MELTDTEVLAQLKTKRVRLLLELERVDTAIKAFEEVKEIDPWDAVRFDDDITADTDELAIATLFYNPKTTVEKKIQFVLSKIGKGDARDITQYLIRIDKNVKDEKALHTRITYVASRLFNLNIIEAEKVGKKNVYRLKRFN
jgi:tetratricopeptide (TPR) repeat protein